MQSLLSCLTTADFSAGRGRGELGPEVGDRVRVPPCVPGSARTDGLLLQGQVVCVLSASAFQSPQKNTN